MSVKQIIFGVIVMALLVLPVSAISFTITPTQSSTTSVSGACGGNGNLNFAITNTGAGGMLCWYTSTDFSTPQKLSTSCIQPGATATYPATVKLPTSSGSRTVTVQLDCFDFWGTWNNRTDTCVDSYDYSQATSNSPKIRYSEAKQDTDPAIAPRYASASCSAIQYTVSPSNQPITLFAGQSKSLAFSVNNPTAGQITCSYSGDFGSGQLGPSGQQGAIPAGSSQSFSVTVQAPSGSAGSQTMNGQVSCTDSLGQQGTQPFSVVVTYSQDPAVSAITAAQTSINDAKSQLQTTEQAIQAQTALGVDTTASTGLLQQGKSFVTQAQTALTSATNSKTSGDATTAKTYADQALAFAQQASTMNGQILGKLEEEKKAFASGGQEASNLVSSAKSKIAEAQSWIDRAEAVVANATSLGMDTVSAKTKIANAKSSLSNAQSYLQQATSSFDAKNYNLAKTNANSALQNAESAKTSATSAHDSLYDVVQKVSIAAGLMTDANTEIQKADQTYAKLTIVVRETKKYADLSSVEADIAAQKSVLDQAKDYASQAQNRFKAGQYNEAVDLATKARDNGSSSKNRLDRIVEKLTTTVQDALAKSLVEAKTNAQAADSAIQGASSTYGAPGEKIVEAQQNAKDAQLQLQAAEAKVNDAKSTASLQSFLETAASAFETLQAAVTKSSEAKTAADAAKNDALTKVGVGVVAALGLGGGGFLWWRRSIKGKKHAPAPEHKPSDKESKGTIHCKKCQSEHPHGTKFCAQCGIKLG